MSIINRVATVVSSLCTCEPSGWWGGVGGGKQVISVSTHEKISNCKRKFIILLFISCKLGI